MARATYKKANRTRFEGQCKGGRWVETVATKKTANRRARRQGKVALRNLDWKIKNFLKKCLTNRIEDDIIYT